MIPMRFSTELTKEILEERGLTVDEEMGFTMPIWKSTY